MARRYPKESFLRKVSSPGTHLNSRRVHPAGPASTHFFSLHQMRTNESINELKSAGREAHTHSYHFLTLWKTCIARRRSSLARLRVSKRPRGVESPLAPARRLYMVSFFFSRQMRMKNGVESTGHTICYRSAVRLASANTARLPRTTRPPEFSGSENPAQTLTYHWPYPSN